VNLNQDKVPIDLEEALVLLKEALNPNDILELKKLTARQMHLEVGGTIRNDWSLWETGNILNVWFKQAYNTDHADDISAIILECLLNDLNGEPRKDRAFAKKLVDIRKKKKI